MDLPLVSCDELVARCDVGGGHFSTDEPPVLLVDLTTEAGGRGATDDALTARFVDQVMAWPYVVVGVGSSATHRSPIGSAVDVVFEPDDVTLGAVVDNVGRVPIAAVTLVTLLRIAPVSTRRSDSSRSLPPTRHSNLAPSSPLERLDAPTALDRGLIDEICDG